MSLWSFIFPFLILCQLKNLFKLYAEHTKAHLPSIASWPYRESFRNPKTSIMPKTGSTVIFLSWFKTRPGLLSSLGSIWRSTSLSSLQDGKSSACVRSAKPSANTYGVVSLSLCVGIALFGSHGRFLFDYQIQKLNWRRIRNVFHNTLDMSLIRKQILKSIKNCFVWINLFCFCHRVGIDTIA